MSKNINCKEIQIISGEDGHLGSGSFGVVRAGYHKEFGMVAAKCCDQPAGKRKNNNLERK